MLKSVMILAMCASPLLAQAARTATLGDRVRVFAPKAGYAKLTGQVIATTPDALQLRLADGTEVAVQRLQIAELNLSVASRRNIVPGIVVGALVGGVATFLWGPEQVTAQNVNEPVHGSVPKINIALAAIGGGVIGGLVGNFSRSDRWVALSPRP